MMYKDELIKLYSVSQKPARYLGGEYNQPSMTKDGVEAKMCICFPDTYEIAMSNVGIRILYHMINDRKDAICERCFMPWVDLRDSLIKKNLPLCSIETITPLREFDVVGFSIQYELCYTNVVSMMELAGIPLYAKDRGDEYPLVIAGGPCMANPEPFAEYFDIMTVGDGEDSLTQIMDEVILAKKTGVSKAELKKRLMSIQGVICPEYDYPIYGDDGKIKDFTRVVKKAVVKDLDKAYFPTKIMLPSVEAVHDRSVIELYRGCMNGCRFCQACFFYRPLRKRKLDTLVKYAEELMANTGFEEMSLSSLSTGDYPGLKDLVEQLKILTKKFNCRLSLPSMRLDTFDGEFVSASRTNSLTFAPEAGTQRLRNVINKNITDEDIDKTIRLAADLGYESLKLYFIIGLPTETDEDLDGIVNIIDKIQQIYVEKKKIKYLRIVLSTAVFIPKPVTPFQWERQIPEEEVIRRQTYLGNALKGKRGVTYNWHSSDASILEAVFARGDRRLGKVIQEAHRLGCIFDSWSEYFDMAKWREAFTNCGIDMSTYLDEQNTNTYLPHEYIDMGVTRRYFLQERDRAYRAETLPPCTHNCHGCGAKKMGECGL